MGWALGWALVGPWVGFGCAWGAWRCSEGRRGWAAANRATNTCPRALPLSPSHQPAWLPVSVSLPGDLKPGNVLLVSDPHDVRGFVAKVRAAAYITTLWVVALVCPYVCLEEPASKRIYKFSHEYRSKRPAQPALFSRLAPLPTLPHPNTIVRPYPAPINPKTPSKQITDFGLSRLVGHEPSLDNHDLYGTVSECPYALFVLLHMSRWVFIRWIAGVPAAVMGRLSLRAAANAPFGCTHAHNNNCNSTHAHAHAHTCRCATWPPRSLTAAATSPATCGATAWWCGRW